MTLRRIGNSSGCVSKSNARRCPFVSLIPCVEEIPRQMNGCDCGVFMCKYADYIAMGCPLTFHQRDMEYFRLRIIADAMSQGIA